MRLILVLAMTMGVYGLVAPPKRIGFQVPVAPILVLALATLSFAVGVPLQVAVIGGLVATVGPGAARRVRVRRSTAAARELWPDFLAIVRGRIGSGDPLPEAVRVAARSLGGPFRQLELAWGGSFLSELDRVRAAWGDPIADRVLVTLRVAVTTGGSHFDSVLSALATALSDEMQIRAAHEAAVTQQRLTAGVALVAPWAILVLSLGTNPQTAASFATSGGRAILLGGGVATIGGYVLARRSASLNAPPRVFE